MFSAKCKNVFQGIANSDSSGQWCNGVKGSYFLGIDYPFCSDLNVSMYII